MNTTKILTVAFGLLMLAGWSYSLATISRAEARHEERVSRHVEDIARIAQNSLRDAVLRNTEPAATADAGRPPFRATRLDDIEAEARATKALVLDLQARCPVARRAAR